MLLNKQTLQGIAEGRISLAFRKWKRPTVKSEGQLRTAIGVLAIDSVDLVSERAITKQDALRAGYASRQELLAELNERPDGQLYRIVLHYQGKDPRLDLRQQTQLSQKEVDEVRHRLTQMDARSRRGPWTAKTLRLIAKNPGKRAADLAQSLGMETKRFKADVRKLKELGLTQSLKVGYQLSPRGKAICNK